MVGGSFYYIPEGGGLLTFSRGGGQKNTNEAAKFEERRLSSRLPLFCVAKQAKNSPVRRLGTLTSDFGVFNGAGEGVDDKRKSRHATT